MSRILQKTGSFIPQGLIPEREEEAPVWGNFVKKIEQEPNQSASRSNTLSKRHSHTPNLRKKADSSSRPPPQERVKESPEKTQQKNSPVQEQKTADIPPHMSNMQKADDTAMQSSPPPPPSPPQETAQESPAIDLEALKKEHFQQGLQQGVEKGRTELEQEYGSALKAFQSSCEQLNATRELILQNSSQEIKELVFLIAEKIIRHSLENQKESIMQTVEEAIRLAVKSDEFIITLNPDDYDTIHSHTEELIQNVSGLEHIILQTDPALDPGGCIIESSNCTVDATVANQMKILKDVINEE